MAVTNGTNGLGVRMSPNEGAENLLLKTNNTSSKSVRNEQYGQYERYEWVVRAVRML